MEHPFYVEGKGWVEAKDLKAGDEVRNAEGETGEVEKITTEETSQEMYNLIVDEAHTFYVGDGQWLVHNVDVCGLLGASGGPYKSTEMVNHRWDWDKMNGVQYLDEEGRNMLEIFVKDGMLVDVNGNPLNGNFIAIMDSNGHIFAGTGVHGSFHHSSFLSGGPISYAGDITTTNGMLTQITGQSGHYFPPFPEYNNQFLEELAERGVDVSDIVSIHY